MPMTGTTRCPTRRPTETPNLGVHRRDRRHPRRHGASKASPSSRSSSSEGGTLIVEGSTATIFPAYGITTRRDGRGAGVALRPRLDPARRTGATGRARSPTATTRPTLPVYFNQAPVLNAGGGGIPAEFAGFLGGGGPPNRRRRQNITPMANRLNARSPLDARGRARRPSGRRPTRRRAFRADGAPLRHQPRRGARPRVVLRFPTNPNDMLLLGHARGGQALVGPRGGRRRAGRQGPRGDVRDASVLALADAGHVTSSASTRILNWNDLDAGKPEPKPAAPAASSSQQQP